MLSAVDTVIIFGTMLLSLFSSEKIKCDVIEYITLCLDGGEDISGHISPLLSPSRSILSIPSVMYFHFFWTYAFCLLFCILYCVFGRWATRDRITNIELLQGGCVAMLKCYWLLDIYLLNQYVEKEMKKKKSIILSSFFVCGWSQYSFLVQFTYFTFLASKWAVNRCILQSINQFC